MPCIYRMRVSGVILRARESANVFWLKMQALLNLKVGQGVFKSFIRESAKINRVGKFNYNTRQLHMTYLTFNLSRKMTTSVNSASAPKRHIK